VAINTFADDSRSNEIDSGFTIPDIMPWSSALSDQPPSVSPFKLPTFDGKERDFKGRVQPLIKPPIISADAIFETISNCYPAKSFWDLEVSLKGQLGVEINDITNTDIGSNYVAIVASMPLYSATEMSRSQDREYKRRNESAKYVTDFVSSIAKRNHSIRLLALYSALEQRSALRVQQGIVTSIEQIGYLEKVAEVHEQVISNQAMLMESRLALVALCRPTEAGRINRYLTELTVVPAASEVKQN
jgi:hypothetical protein